MAEQQQESATAPLPLEHSEPHQNQDNAEPDFGDLIAHLGDLPRVTRCAAAAAGNPNFELVQDDWVPVVPGNGPKLINPKDLKSWKEFAEEKVATGDLKIEAPRK